MKANSVILSLTIFGFAVLLLVIDYKTAGIVEKHDRLLMLQHNQLSELQSNHVDLVESFAAWTKADNQFNDELLNAIKKADNDLYKRIEQCRSSQLYVIEQLKSISLIQKQVVDIFSGNFSTNLVDKKK